MSNTPFYNLSIAILPYFTFYVTFHAVEKKSVNHISAFFLLLVIEFCKMGKMWPFEF